MAKVVLVMRTWMLVAVMVVLIAACSDTTDPASRSVDTTAAAAGSTPAVEVTTSVANQSTSSSGAVDVEVSDEVLDYLAAVEELVAGTSYEEAVIEDPDVFVATGFAFCDRLTDGEEPADVLSFYVENLTGSDIEQADDEALTLAGTILGTAVGHLCPEHTTTIEQGF